MSGVLWVMGIVAAASLWRWWSLWRFPLKTCPACAGRKRIISRFFGAHRVCGRCGGAGEVRRLGAGKED